MAASLLAGALVSATAWSIVQQAGTWAPPLDDAYIHAAFARQWAAGHLALRDQPLGGESSPGFAGILALAELGSMHWAPQFALLLGALAFLCLPFLLAGIVPAELRVAPAVALACALGGPLLFHAQSGMETLPYLALGLASLWCFGHRRFRLAALFAAAATWMRLDAWTLWCALAVGVIEDRRRSGDSVAEASAAFVRLMFPGLLLAALAVLWLSLATGGFPPATLAGRRWLEQLDPRWTVGGVGVGVAEFLVDWLRALSAQFGFGQLATALPSSFDVWLGPLRLLWKLAAAWLVLDGFWRILRWSRRPVESAALRLFLLWALGTLLQYCIMLPSRGHAGRYQPQLLLGFLLLVAIAGAHWWRHRWARPLIALVALGAVAGSFDAVRLTGRAAAHVARVHHRAARDLAASLPKDSRVAAFDIGCLAYEQGIPWIDMSGLCDRNFLAFAAERTTAFHLRDRGATHVVLPLTEGDGPGSLRDRLGLSELDGAALLPVREWASSNAAWGQAFQFSGNAARRLVLYEVP